MNRKIVKLTCIISIILCIILSISNVSYAGPMEKIPDGDVPPELAQYLNPTPSNSGDTTTSPTTSTSNSGKSALSDIAKQIAEQQLGDDSEAKNEIQNVGWIIITLLRNAGIIAAFIIVMILGIKYITASVEQKAVYKKTMMPYVIGAVALFAATGIATLVINLAGNLNNIG